MVYIITIDYTTGDSFGSQRTEEEIGMAWKNLDKAKQALQEIKEHHEAYQLANQRSYLRPKAFFSVETIKNKPWFYGGDGGRYWEYRIMLEQDDGTRRQISPFWCGYFETLHAAQITSSPDSDLRIEFD